MMLPDFLLRTVEERLCDVEPGSGVKQGRVICDASWSHGTNQPTTHGRLSYPCIQLSKSRLSVLVSPASLIFPRSEDMPEDGPGTYEPLGCFKDDIDDRVLTRSMFESPEMTADVS